MSNSPTKSRKLNDKSSSGDIFNGICPESPDFRSNPAISDENVGVIGPEEKRKELTFSRNFFGPAGIFRGSLLDQSGHDAKISATGDESGFVTGDRCILAGCSNVLAELFRKHPDRGQVIILPKVHSAMMRKVIHFIYNGKTCFEDEEEQLDFFSTLRYLNMTFGEKEVDGEIYGSRRRDEFVEFEKVKVVANNEVRPLSATKVAPNGFKSTRFNNSVDYNSDPETAAECNIFDSHCHLDRLLNNSRYKKLETFMKENFRDFGSKFEGCISVMCDPRTWYDLKYHQYLNEPNVFSIFGCHPKFAHRFGSQELDLLVKHLENPACVGLGEIGLDYSNQWIHSKPEVQKKVFRKQLEIAMQLNLPICLHVRAADEDAFNIMNEVNLPTDWPIHMHCFTGSWTDCKNWMNIYKNMKFGFTPNYFVTEVVERLPLNKILLETDAPYFKPLKLKTSRHDVSHPGFVFHTASQIGSVKKLNVNVVLKECRKNLGEVYRKLKKREVGEEENCSI